MSRLQTSWCSSGWKLNPRQLSWKVFQPCVMNVAECLQFGPLFAYTFSQFCASLLFPASILCVPLKQSSWTRTGYTRTCVFQLLTASMELISQMRFLSWSIIIFSCWFFCLSFCDKNRNKHSVIERVICTTAKQNVTCFSSVTSQLFSKWCLIITSQLSIISSYATLYVIISECRAVKAVM